MWRWIDLPPIWLGAHLLVLWALPGESAGRAWEVAGAVLVAVGLALVAWAAATMILARTTVIPGRMPEALVTGGPFAFSRNPIYLGDVVVLAGAVLWIGPLWGLVLVPLLMGVLTRRFILPEEARLRAAFGDNFVAWARRVRRWI